MLDIDLLRKEPEKVKRAIATKNADPALVERFTEIDAAWRKLNLEIDTLRAEQKKLTRSVHSLRPGSGRAGQGAARDIAAAQRNKEHIKEKEAALRDVEKERDIVWMQIPNVPSDDTPVGKNEADNKVLYTRGEPKEFSFTPKSHVELGESLGLIDTARAGEIAGARFAYLKGDVVKLEFALMQYGMSILTNQKALQSIADAVSPGYSAKPFVPVLPPVMIRPDVFEKMARLEPKDDRYYIPSDDVYLIGSAEHTLGPLHMQETIPEAELPIRYVGFSTSFRREAGSYGKDTRGIIRLHQFNKLEMESFTLPEHSRTEQDFFVAIQEYLMQSLGMPYRVVAICTGDMGAPDVRQIDIETWMPGEGRYRETHTSDSVGDYQSRRLGTRVRRKNGGTEFAHMNDATVFSERPLAAIMENYQTEDGKIEVPEALRPYVGKDVIG